jgi:hypothetical protein
MNELTNKKTFPGSGRFDPINSTYKHKIELVNGRDLTGYSKGLLQNEMVDKIVLLERVILRLYHNGYLNYNKTAQINFYLNETLTASSQELILILRPNSYEFGVNRDYINDLRLGTFLSRMYEQIKHGVIVTKSLSHKSGNPKEQYLFDVRKTQFNNEMELHKYILARAREGWPDDVVTNFFVKAKEKLDDIAQFSAKNVRKTSPEALIRLHKQSSKPL